MFKLDFASVSFLIGVVLAFVLLALDKAEKLKGPWPLVLLGIGALLTLPLALNVPIVANAQGVTKGFRIFAAICVVGFVYSVLAAWISAPEIKTESSPSIAEQSTPASPSPTAILESVKDAVREASEPERADIFAALVIESVQNDRVKYHLEIKNGQVPVTITNITLQTPNFLQNEEGPYIPKSLRPGENLSITGDLIGL
jgi:hypothetical protein